jgi:ligand-binding sensor domain-containing protein
MSSRAILAAMSFCMIVIQERLQGRQESLRPIGGWKNFTDMKSVNGIAFIDGRIAGATGGGVFVYFPSTNSFRKVTTSEGLSSNELSAAALVGDELWVGARNGMLDYFREGAWSSVRDIYESTRIQKGVRRFLVSGSSLYIATDFGIVVYRLDSREFGDTYASFGFSTQTGVNGIFVHNNTLWAATDLGLVSAPLSSANLSSPTAWTVYQTAQGLPSNQSFAVTAFHDTIVVGTSAGAAYFNGSVFQALSSRATRDFSQRGASLVVLTEGGGSFRVESIDYVMSAPQQLVEETGSASVIAVEPTSNQIVVGTTNRGMAVSATPSWRFLVPNGPNSSLFSSVAVDENGRLWTGSGINGRGTGFCRYDPSLTEAKQWKNFTVAGFSIMAHDDYYKISIGLKEVVWVSSWGRGVIEIVGDSIRRRIDHVSKPSLAGAVPQDPSFVVVGSVQPDAGGSTWFVNRTAINGNYLAQLVNDTTFVYYTNQIAPTEGRFTAMVIDEFGTKWLANSEPQDKPPTGLFFFNENMRVSGTSLSGGWGQLTANEGLPNNAVLSLAVDLEGEVCVGTDLGLMIITDPLNPRIRRLTSFPLREQVIQAIAVDALNNKWVGTKEGVFVVNPDGTQLLQHYSVFTTGGRLIDNDVRSIAIDQRRGIVYMGTERGLASLQIAAVRTARSFTTLELGPNPYVIPNSRDLMIGNLVENTTIKILSVSGAMVSQFEAQGGGRAFWNGRSEGGELVPSGIYFVVAFAENGEKVVTGKVAVVRK